MNDFGIKTLKEITRKIGSGATPRGGGDTYKTVGVSLIRSQNVLDFKLAYDGIACIDDEQAYELRNVIVEEKDVLLNITGDSVARCCMANKGVLPARVNQHVAIIRVDEEVASPEFVMYNLLYQKETLLSLSEIGATRKALTKGMIEDLEIQMPSLSEQQSIASVLSSLDDKIDLLHRQNKTLEQMAETLFRQWFVEQTSDSFRVFKLIDIVKQIKPGTNYQPKRTTEGIPFLNVKNLINGFLNYSDINFITKEEYERVHKSWVPEENDLLISRIGTLGEVAVIMKRDLPVAVHYNMLNIKPKDTSHQFLYFLLKSKYFQEKYESIIRQSVQEYVAVDDVHQIDIFLPIGTSAFIKQEETFIAIFNKIEFNTNQIGVLSNLRDTILPRLMNGTLRVTSN